MLLRSIVLAAATVASMGAQAALTTYAPWDAFYPDAQGLDGVQFNVQSAGGATVALGAHAYKDGVLMPNDGVSTFYGKAGLHPNPPLGETRANWSFDFAWDLGGCTSCTVWLGVDTDPSAAVNFVFGNITAVPQPQSWNLEMAFLTAGYDFDPFATSSTAFRLEVRRGDIVVVGSDITVNVPEPGTLALGGLALAGLGALRRRKA